MTIWSPTLTPGQQKYLSIADALERDIADGHLQPGEKLPTHRDLADALGVTVGTVTRAYAEAERRELTVGEVGRGTFVRSPDDGVDLHRWGIGGAVAASGIDMRHSLAPELRDLERRALESVLSALSTSATSELLQMPGSSASPRHRSAGAAWLQLCGVSCDSDEVLLTCGIQHGITVSLMTLLEPRDVLLAEEFTYPGLKSLASILGIRLRSVALDREGMIPDSLERACRTEPRPKALYIVPTIQNPTCGTLSPTRREAIAQIAERYDLTVIEDQIHALLPPERPAPITSLIPDRTVSLASPSKSIAPGLRVGFIKPPPSMKASILTAINSTVWTVPPLASEVFTRWMESGVAEDIIDAKRAETARRQAIVDEYAGDLDLQRDRSANHFWLKLPETWTEQGFVRAAHEQGVLIPGASVFALGRNDALHAARISIGTPSLAQLRRGLRTVCDLLETSETPALTVI